MLWSLGRRRARREQIEVLRKHGLGRMPCWCWWWKPCCLLRSRGGRRERVLEVVCQGDRHERVGRLCEVVGGESWVRYGGQGELGRGSHHTVSVLCYVCVEGGVVWMKRKEERL